MATEIGEDGLPSKVPTRFRSFVRGRPQMETSGGLEQLKKAAIITGLPVDFAEALLPELSTRMHQAGEEIIKEGEKLDELLFLVKGEIELFVGPPGAEMPVMTVQGPTVLGETCALKGKVHSQAYTARCKSFCDFRTVPYRLLLPLFAHFDDARVVIEKVATLRMQKAEAAREELFQRTYERQQAAGLMSSKTMAFRQLCSPTPDDAGETMSRPSSRASSRHSRARCAPTASLDLDLKGLHQTFEQVVDGDSSPSNQVQPSGRPKSRGRMAERSQSKAAALLAKLPTLQALTPRKKQSSLSARIATLRHGRGPEPPLPASLRSPKAGGEKTPRKSGRIDQKDPFSMGSSPEVLAATMPALDVNFFSDEEARHTEPSFVLHKSGHELQVQPRVA